MLVRVSVLSLVLLSVACAAAPEATHEPHDPLSSTNVFMGTGGFAFGHGSAFPGACAPNGLAKVGPDTVGPYGRMNFIHYSGYWYGDDTVTAFSHLHMHGTGATDYGVLGVMPVDGFDASMRTAAGRQSKFAKESEVGQPGYYATTLERGAVRTELTATTHAAHHRWTWGPGASPWVVVDLDHHLESGRIEVAEATLDPANRRVVGRLHHVGGMSGRFDGYEVFFELRTKQPWKARRVWSEGVAPAEGDATSGQKAGFAFELDLAPGEAGEMQVGLSLVDAQGARRHLEAELPAWDFEGTRQATRAAWETRLKRMRVYGGDVEDARTFYSSLHHTFMMPSRVGDADGRYRYAGAVHDTGGDWVFLNDFSIWDTYRTLHPLYVLTAPDLARDSARSLTAMATASGYFPVWPLATGDADVMIGAGADIVMADAYVKGVRDFDIDAAWPILRAAALDEIAPAAGRGGRNGQKEFLTLGWVPAESNGRSVSATTEYAHDDFALANLAGALGHESDEQTLRARSKGYRELFDPETQFLRARSRDGGFLPDFDPFSGDHFAEANAWQSLWMAAHDVPGFADLFGGRPQMVEKLTLFFDEAIAEAAAIDPDSRDFMVSWNLPRKYYWPANEPDIQAVFMFAQAGRPDLTQKYLPWIRRTYYGSGPDGLPGNDDGGTMSAWFIFSALGFFPLAGSTEYIVGAPLFPRVELDIEGGVFTIEARGVSEQAVYVKSVTLNGAPLTTPSFTHDAFKPGGSLVFEMTDAPTSWGRF